METIHILHTNDIHSHLENWPRIANELRKQRAEKKGSGETVLTFDIGDAADRAHPLAEATNGQAITRLLNDGLYDAVTIGNNEGIGSTKKEMNHLYDDAHFDVLVANLLDKETGHHPDWARGFKIYHSKDNHRIGVFGLTYPFVESYDPLGWDIEDPFERIRQIIAIFSEGVDTFVLLSHLGIRYDREIAAQFPEISVILGAHTHHLLPEGERVNGTLLAGAGRYGEHLGHVELSMEEGEVVSSAVNVTNVKEDLPPAKNEKEVIRHYQQLGHQLLIQQEIAFLPETFDVYWKKTSELVELGMRAVKEYARTDAAVLNAGLFMQPLLEGTVTRNDLHQTLPHPMRIVKVTRTGDDMSELLQEMMNESSRLVNKTYTGSGFRGQIIGEICYNGITFSDASGEPLWQGEPIRANKSYTFATADFFLYAPFFPSINQKGKNEVIFPYFIRTIVGDYLSKHYPLEGRKKKKP